jgi:Ca2+-transporting ATPase
VLFLEFVIDPACAFVFEADPEPADIMRRKPRRPDQPLFAAAVLRRSVLLGLAVLAFGALVYALALPAMADERARALVFFAVVIANLVLIFVSRSTSETLAAILARPNAVFWWIAALACAAITLAIYVPGVASVFRFAPPAPMSLVVVGIAAIAVVLLAGWLLRRAWHQAQPGTSNP